MKNQNSGSSKLGRKPKTTRPLDLELHPQAYTWLETLHAKGRFGNSVENVAIRLLDDRFKQLVQEGELFEMPNVGTAIPFPDQKQSIEQKNAPKTEQPIKTY